LEKSHELVLEVYKLTEKYPKQEIFGLTSQSRRCGASIPSNIAEGFRRRTVNDSLHFYNISQGSLEELRYQMILARDLGYITKGSTKKLVCSRKKPVRFWMAGLNHRAKLLS
jgi:four helix bundle protein